MRMRYPALLLLLTSLTANGQPQPSPYPPFAAPPLAAVAPPGPPFIPIAQGIAIQTRSSASGYTLVIDSASLPPASIRVDIDRNMLLIHANDQRSSSRRQQFGRNGQMQSYSYSSRTSRFNRRLPIPPDADPGNAVREDGEHQVTIFIPRAGLAEEQQPEQSTSTQAVDR